MASTSMKIVIVDDDDALRELLQRRLAKEGWLIQAFDSCAAALRFVREQEVACVISDYHMPHGEDGMTLLELVRREGRARLCILMSAEFVEQVALSQNAPPAYDRFLAKPFSVDDLCRYLDGCLADGALD